MGRVSSPQPCGMRFYLPMHDGATATFDLFEPLGDHVTGGKFIYLNSIKCIPYNVLVDYQVYQIKYALVHLYFSGKALM